MQTATVINLYYGAADTSIALAKGASRQIPGWLDRHGTVSGARLSDVARQNDVQSRTAVAYGCAYSQHMQTDYVKAALMAAWILAIGGLGYVFGTTSLAGWTLVAVLSVVPPVLMRRLWSAPSPSMSETIREVLR